MPRKNLKVVPPQEQAQPERPAFSLLDPDFEYRPAADTDVQRVWRKYGWIPPSELRVPPWEK